MKMNQLTTKAIDELRAAKTRFRLQIGVPPVAISSPKAPLFADGVDSKWRVPRERGHQLRTFVALEFDP